METIFKTPLVFESTKENVVLIYSDYIIAEITKENVDLIIEEIDNNSFKTTDYESVVDIKNVLGYDFEWDSDSYIMFDIKNDSGTSFKTIDFKDVETTIKAEESFRNQFQSLGFTRTKQQMTSMSAAVTPLIVTGIVAIIGGLLTWMAYEFEDYQSPRTRIVKWYVYLMVKISKSVGHTPFLILAVLSVLACLFWTIKRMANPPLQVSAVKH